MLSVRRLTKTYPGGVVGLHPTDLTVEAGERLVLLGPSGSGKSTLLRLILGLEEPSGGEVWVNGERVDRLPPHRRGVVLLPQRPALYPNLTVRGNLEAVGPPLPQGRRESKTCSASLHSSPATPTSCPAGRNSGWRWPSCC